MAANGTAVPWPAGQRWWYVQRLVRPRRRLGWCDVDGVDGVFPFPVGSCVYCGSTDGLSDEHVVPLGLGGTWKLLEASCPRCRDATSLLELRVLRQHFHALRTVTGMPTRRKGERPSRLRQDVTVAGERLSLSLSKDEHPAPILFQVFGPPAALLGATSTEGLSLITLMMATRAGFL